MGVPEVDTAGWVAFNACPDERPRTIAIGGVARGGTSFAASLVYHLGAAFAPASQGRAALTPAMELKSLRKAMAENDKGALRAAIRNMDEEHDLWAWKLPEFAHNPTLALDNLRNTHFVFVVKNPFSVMMRAHQVKSREPFATSHLKIAEGIMSRYGKMLDFCRNTQRPVFLFSYERGVRDTAALVIALAGFLGLDCVDPEAVTEQVREDQRNYLARSIPAP